MSRGPGKWQRLILEALEVKPWIFVTNLLPEGASRSQSVAIRRAASRLADNGAINLFMRGKRLKTHNRDQAGYGMVATRPEIDDAPLYFDSHWVREGRIIAYIPRCLWDPLHGPYPKRTSFAEALEIIEQNQSGCEIISIERYNRQLPSISVA